MKLLLNNSKGFTLLELMITVAIIGVLATIGLPAYNGYRETASMTKVSAAYEFAIRTTRSEFAKNTSKYALGLASTLPVDETGWIELFNPGNKTMAPGGGNIYVAAGDNGVSDTVGAVSIRFNPDNDEVKIRRPKYISLEARMAKITEHTIDITKE